MSRPAADSPAQGTVELLPEHCVVTTRFRPPELATRVFTPGRPLGSIGDYELVQQLGRCMFVGHHRAAPQAFAIRLLDPVPPGRPWRRARQRSAARARAAIEHPNVVRTLEVGVHEGRVYLVMEYLRGTPLESLFELHGAPPIAQVIRIGTHVARGLEAAHGR